MLAKSDLTTFPFCSYLDFPCIISSFSFSWWIFQSSTFLGNIVSFIKQQYMLTISILKQNFSFPILLNDSPFPVFHFPFNGNRLIFPCPNFDFPFHFQFCVSYFRDKPYWSLFITSLMPAPCRFTFPWSIMQPWSMVVIKTWSVCFVGCEKPWDYGNIKPYSLLMAKHQNRLMKK